AYGMEALPLSFVAQRLDRVEARGAIGGIEGRQHREREGQGNDGAGGRDVDLGGQAREIIDLRGEQLGGGEAGNELPDLVDLHAEQEAQDGAGDGSDDADAGAGDQEDAHDRPLARTHRTQDADIAALVLNQHHEPGNDVESGYQHDHR